MFQLIQRMNLFFQLCLYYDFMLSKTDIPLWDLHLNWLKIWPFGSTAIHLNVNKTQPSISTSCVMYMHTGLFCSSGKGLIIFPWWRLRKKKNWVSTCGISVYISYQYLDRERHWFINESTKTNATKLEARYLFSNHSVVSPRSKFLAYGFPWKGILSIFLFGHLHMFCLVTVV